MNEKKRVNVIGCSQIRKGAAYSVRRKGSLFNNKLEAVSSRAIKRNEHRVNIRRKRFHNCKSAKKDVRNPLEPAISTGFAPKRLQSGLIRG